MNVKWLAFMVFVWLIGVFIGATYEGSSNWSTTMEYNISGPDGDNPSVMEVLFSPTSNTYYAQSGNIQWWNPSSGYWQCWLQVLSWDFPFTKPYDANSNGVIDVAEEHNNDIGKYSGYFFQAFGLIGLASFLFAFFEFLQGVLPW